MSRSTKKPSPKSIYARESPYARLRSKRQFRAATRQSVRATQTAGKDWDAATPPVKKGTGGSDTW
jgi:hypothetical protein